MAIKNTYFSEDWTKVYQAFKNVNFTSYDYDTVKASLLEYMKLYYKETFNDYIESSEFIALLELFAYTVEQLAYRVDMMSHENFITTAQRKQSILKLAKLVSYTASRNYPANGVVKLSSITVTESIIDSLGNDLNGKTITWNDPNNNNWKEQFILAISHVMVNRFGQPDKTIQLNDVSMQLYTLNNQFSSFFNNVYQFTANTGSESFPMEVVPSDLNEEGILEKHPDNSNKMTIVYANDGLGDGSEYTGFLMYIKQGTLSRQDINFNNSIPNRTIDISVNNINQIDVWLNSVNADGSTIEKWENVDSLADQNVTFNLIKNRKKFEVETLEQDRIRLIFGDGDFSEIPLGSYHLWYRQSLNRTSIIPKSRIQNEQMAFQYTSSIGLIETCSLGFSLVATIQNGSSSEDIEHIRNAAPATYYAQNRMVNGQDYNTYMLRDPSILRLKTINRTFAGQPKYLEWNNDASGQYENVKLFGDDLKVTFKFETNKLNVATSGRSIIDKVIEPLLEKSSIKTLHTFISNNGFTDGVQLGKGVVSPVRSSFIEDTREGLWTKYNSTENIFETGNGSISSPKGAKKEKTLIQGALDSHWYGEPLEYVLINNTTYGKISDPGSDVSEDGNIWQYNLPRTIDSKTAYIPGDIGSLLQQVSFSQSFGLKFNRFTNMVGSGFISYQKIGVADPLDTIEVVDQFQVTETWTIEVNPDKTTVSVSSNKRGQYGSFAITAEDAVAGSETTLLSVVPSAPIDFYIKQGGIPFEAGDMFIFEVSNVLPVTEQSVKYKTNGTGYWEIIQGTDTGNTTDSGDPKETEYLFDGSDPKKAWTFWITSQRDSNTDEITGYNVYYRELKLIVESPNTKFWYNNVEPVIDPSTQEIVRDKLRILKSNFDSNHQPWFDFEFDVVDSVYNQTGIQNMHQLEVAITSKYAKSQGSEFNPNLLLMVEDYIDGSDFKKDFIYWEIPTGKPEIYQPLVSDYLTATDLADVNLSAAFMNWPQDRLYLEVDGVRYGRNKSRQPLDFMWQHFSPFTHLIDPSVTNVHDTYVLTRGYYENIINYISGRLPAMPAPPTQLELKSQYATMLQHKMISDTVVLHPGKIKLLFGSLARPELRGKFRIVKAGSSTLSVEQIKQEALSIINQFFTIDSWDFGDSFFATELFSTIHQRLSTEISSVVLVPTYSVNSFGSLFTIESGINEILQSCATLADIEIVDALTASTLRQS